jgi:methyltransferase (TIGR00027 family)
MFKYLKRIVYPVADLAEAKRWYSDILGKQPLFDAPFAAIFAVGDCSLSLTLAQPAAGPMPDTGKSPAVGSGSVAAPAMAVYWEVDDIETAVDQLISKGARLHTPIAAALNIRTARLIDPFGNILGLTDQGAAVAQQTVEKKPSDTAMTVAFCRALAAAEERGELRGPDDLAILFLGSEAKTLLATAQTKRWAIDNLVTSRLYGYFLARTAYFDDVFADHLRQGIAQVVLLGAGYDTRAIRYHGLLGLARVFELDVATTQQAKREKLAAAGIQPPAALTYVPVNFEKDDLAMTLRQAGYDAQKPTLFIWEGVLYYLTKPAVEAVLGFIGQSAAPGSRLCFDSLQEELQSVNPAEPFRFWMPAETMAAWLPRFGLRPIDTVEQPAMLSRYLPRIDGSVGEGCLDSFFFMLAERA